jgi:hypothetical protein
MPQRSNNSSARFAVDRTEAIIQVDHTLILALRPEAARGMNLYCCGGKGKMGVLTGIRYGDAANELLGFYQDKAKELEESGQHFMAAIALGFALETAVLAYLLVEFGEEDGSGELQIPDTVNMSELLQAANQIDVLNAPINIPSHVGDDTNTIPPKYIAKDVVHKIRRFRNLIHPACALRESFDPRTFTREQLREFKDMYESILHSLLYYI